MRHTRILVTRYGVPDSLQVIEDEFPEPELCEVRVRLLAAGVSLPALLMREGFIPRRPPSRWQRNGQQIGASSSPLPTDLEDCALVAFAVW